MTRPVPPPFDATAHDAPTRETRVVRGDDATPRGLRGVDPALVALARIAASIGRRPPKPKPTSVEAADDATDTTDESGPDAA